MAHGQIRRYVADQKTPLHQRSYFLIILDVFCRLVIKALEDFPLKLEKESTKPVQLSSVYLPSSLIIGCLAENYR